MAPIQTKINFNIRKKRSNNTKLTEKENNDNIKLQTRKSVPNINYIIDGNSSDDESTPCQRRSSQRTPGKTKSLGRTVTNKRSLIIISDSEDDELSSSPSKQDKRNSSDESGSSENTSPKTPSHLISKLLLDSPSSDKEKSEEKLFTPKRLFSPAGRSYQQARQALHSSAPENMPGREEELEQLEDFLQDHLDNRGSGTLYVSGPPGTGKTACLTKVMHLPQFKTGYKVVYANCTSMKSSGSIYSRIAEELNLNVTGKAEKYYLKSIEKYLLRNKKMILLVLDEIDQLDSRNQSVLYTVFEWPSKPNSNLVLIGIANALDLTDRILPRLQARLEMKPKLMHFAPYTKPQIVNILTERLKQSGVSDMFSTVALQLLAGKVAAVSGDVRRALDIGRRVVELAEVQRTTDALPLQPTTDHVSNTTSTKKSPVKSTGAVNLKEVMSVLSDVYSTSQKLHEEQNETFPLQQKVLICTLLLMLKKCRNKDVTLGKLHEVYCRVCKKRNLLDVGQGEFLSMCQLVETRGVLRVQGKNASRFSKISLQWDEEEVASALQDKQLLATILSDTSALS